MQTYGITIKNKPTHSNIHKQFGTV